jgi:hypothetical protein
MQQEEPVVSTEEMHGEGREEARTPRRNAGRTSGNGNDAEAIAEAVYQRLLRKLNLGSRTRTHSKRPKKKNERVYEEDPGDRLEQLVSELECPKRVS